MRILIVGLNYAPEPIGIGPYTTGLAEFLAERGHQVEVIAGRPYYPQWKPYPGFSRRWRTSRENGVRITRCPHYVPSRPSGLRRIIHHLSFAASALPIAAWRGRRLRPDVVLCIAPSLLSMVPAKLAARLSGAKVALHLQDFEVDAALATGLVRGDRLARLLYAAERKALHGVDGVSTISANMAAKLVAKGVPPDRVVELRNWANALPTPGGRSQPLREAWGLAGKAVALYSGSVGRKQGAGLIVAAARALAHRDDIAFVICGAGPELESLKAEAEGLGNIHFHPLQPAERLMELLSLATLHVLPQVTLAADLVLPSKLTNMLLSARPVVATAEPGTALYDEVAGCGIAVPPGDAGALSNAISQLVDDAQLARKLGVAAAQRAAERWSREAILAEFERYLLTLAKPNGAAGED